MAIAASMPSILGMLTPISTHQRRLDERRLLDRVHAIDGAHDRKPEGAEHLLDHYQIDRVVIDDKDIGRTILFRAHL